MFRGTEKFSVWKVVQLQGMIFEVSQLIQEDICTFNLVPGSRVDEAEGEIWQSKKICFS